MKSRGRPRAASVARAPRHPSPYLPQVSPTKGQLLAAVRGVKKTVTLAKRELRDELLLASGKHESVAGRLDEVVLMQQTIVAIQGETSQTLRDLRTAVADIRDLLRDQLVARDKNNNQK